MISEMNRRLNQVKNNVCAHHLILEGFNLGKSWMANIGVWLRKIVNKENWISKRRLQHKFKILKRTQRLRNRRTRIRKIREYLMQK